MANKQIGDLTAATTPLAGTELVHIVQGGNSRKSALSDILTQAGAIPVRKRVQVHEEQATGVDSGGFTSGSYVKRLLNAVILNEVSGASLASNQVTLPAGTYEYRGNGVTFFVERNQVRLYNVTDSAVVEYGTTAYSGGGANTAASEVIGKFTITSAKVFELQHRCETTRANNGFGISNSFGNKVVYSTLIFDKVA